MAHIRNRSIIVIDDDVIVKVDDHLEILDPSSFYSPTSPQATTAPPTSTSNTSSHQTSFAGHQKQSSESRAGSPVSNPPNLSTITQFRSLDWGPKTSRLSNTSIRSSTIAPRGSKSSGSSISQLYRKSIAPSSRTSIHVSMLGTQSEPIDLASEVNMSFPQCATSGFNSSVAHSRVQIRGSTECQRSILLLDEEVTEPLDRKHPSTALARSLARQPMANDELIDLDDIENFGQKQSLEDIEDISRDQSRARVRSLTRLPAADDVFIDLDDIEDTLGVQDAYLRDPRPREGRRPSKIERIDRRNQSIIDPYRKLITLPFGNSTLKQNKTLELHDGSFLRIKDIVENTVTKEIRLRGHRLERVRDMNGMLEKKMNECVICLEVDLDDPRDALEQAAVEVPLAEVARLRNIRITNEKFPMHRHVLPNEFPNKDSILLTGGLTVRWKYTCRYASAHDRNQNVYKERTLERIKPDDCTSKDYSVSNTTLRSRWRGETIRGGAYRPTIDTEAVFFLPDMRSGSHTSIGSSEPDDFTLLPVRTVNQLIHTIDLSGSDEEEDYRVSFSMEMDSRPNMTKRKFSEVGMSPKMQASIQAQKRGRHSEEKSVKETREGISRLNLHPAETRGSRTHSMALDLPAFKKNSNLTRFSLPGSIDISSSNLSVPPGSGSVRTASQTPKIPVIRTAGQKLTYGDGFSGAGGSTRGAVMAGLRVLWGFDSWEHACKNWRANFPWATCYSKAAHEFVELAKKAENQGFPDLMKVDILHLSPPCQFFSPAHTINGVNDEMNTASLFAVQAVIEVAKPRVVTLEQTFGITWPRFRFYFNALIQMFTTHDFSVRWAIVPLQQWGLPQRRHRLIIIASCPGEILPRMPAATHGEPPLKPYTSVQSVLSSIPRPHPQRPQDPLHRLSAVAHTKDFLPWDPSGILPRAMTTSGGQNYHPSGKRDLTLREYATLQGFPACHVFDGKLLKKQIGNAVPPCVAKVLFESIKRDLDAADGIAEEPELIE